MGKKYFVIAEVGRSVPVCFCFYYKPFILVIPEGCSRESVVAVVFIRLRNNRSPTETVGDDNLKKVLSQRGAVRSLGVM